MSKFNALYPDSPGYADAKFIAEVHTYGDREGVFSSNSLRFEKEEDALAYAEDLADRWTAVKEYRVSPVKT